MSERVSIVISTYKRPREILLRAVRSVLNQTYDDIELFVVDDNPDNLKLNVELIRELESLGDNIRYLTYPGNRGASYARNYGAYAATGTYVGFLDDDDEYLPMKVMRQVEMLSSGGYVLVTCDSEYVFMDSDGYESRREVITQFHKTDISLEDILLSGQSGVPIPLIRLESFKSVGGFNEELPSSQDLDLWIKLAQIGRIGRVPETLFRVYWHKGDRISTNVVAKVKGNKYITRQYVRLAQNREGFLVRQYLDLAEILFSAGHICKGLFYITCARMHHPSSDNIIRGRRMVRYGITRFHEVHLSWI